MQHFISNSPWSSASLIKAIQQDMLSHPEFQGGILIIDESAEVKSGENSAGSGRQHNGRLGKIEQSQVGVFASLATFTANSWIDGELFIPSSWFTESAKEKREHAGIPEELIFQTKPQLAWQIIQRIQGNGVPFEAVAMDTLYGRNQELRFNLEKANIEYYADVPADTRVYLSPPRFYHPRTKKGKLSKRVKVSGRSYQVKSLLETPYLNWKRITIRPSEQGMLTADFARVRVWTVYEQTIRQEWLLFRVDEGQLTYILSNASENCSLETMAIRKSHRFFIERGNQNCKSELGWDEFQATKYLAWQHHLALTILASWFVTDIQLDWAKKYRYQPDLLAQYQVDVLPMLSVANIRLLLRAAMPLPQLSPLDAAILVIEHLDNRVRSRKSRLSKTRDPDTILM
jgi:SRSO17 transposase